MSGKCRWTLEGVLPGGKLAKSFVKITTRLALSQESQDELKPKDYLSSDSFTVKLEPQSITVMYYDLVKDSPEWNIINSGYYSGDGPAPPDLQSVFTLTWLSPRAKPLEEWTLNKAHISKIVKNEIDWSNENNFTLEIKFEKSVFKPFYLV